MEDANRLTFTVEQVGSLLGLSRGAAYEAAARGEIPVLRVGRRLLVPKMALMKMLESAAPHEPKGA
jgi:excisionase family DNA binding protein